MSQAIFDFALPTTSWVAPDLAKLPSWRDARRVCIDYETRDPNLTDKGPGTHRGDGYVVGVAFAIEDGPSHYLPVRHEAGGNLDEAKVWEYLKDQASVFGGELLASGVQYEIEWSLHNGIHWRPKRWVDPTIVEPLLDELQRTYKLDHILQRRGLEGKREEILIAACHALGYGTKPKQVKGNLWRLDPKFVGDYAEHDARAPLALARRQEKEIDDQELWEVWELENALIPHLVEMRRRGIRIDLDEVDQLERKAYAVIDDCMRQFSDATGFNLTRADVDRGDALGPAIRGLGIHVPLTNPKEKNPDSKAKPKDSVTKALFLDYADTLDEEGHVGRRANVKHVPAIAALRRAREWNDLAQTCRSRKDHAVRDSNGDWRIHSTFKQTVQQADDARDKDVEGARFGRMASSTPNVQQESVRNAEFGAAWRGVYKPDRDKRWASKDYSQQEPRNWVHYGIKMKLPGAQEFADMWRADPKRSFHKMTAAITGLPVGDAKNCGLGIGYGMGGKKLCELWLGLPTAILLSFKGEPYIGAGPEGQAIIDKYHAGVPFLKPMIKKLQDRVRERGFLILRDAGNRRLRFPMKPAHLQRDSRDQYDWIHKALNRVSQGRAAHQTKKALLALGLAGCPLNSAVHDEFNFSCEEGERGVEEAINYARIMRDADPLLVPNRVTLEIGPDWGHCEEVEFT